MDLVDIALRIEYELDVPFDCGDWDTIVVDRDIRVGDLFARVSHNRVGYQDGKNDIGRVHRFWVEMREAVHVSTNADYKDVEFSSKLEDLFPEPSRARRWLALQAATTYHVPNLMYPKWVPAVCICLATTGFVFEQLQLWRVPVLQNWPVLLIVLGGLMLVETWFRLLWLLRRFRKRFPPKLVTVKDLCRDVQRMNRRLFVVDSPDEPMPAVAPEGELWEKLVKVLVDVLDINPRRIEPDFIAVQGSRSQLAGDVDQPWR